MRPYQSLSPVPGPGESIMNQSFCSQDAQSSMFSSTHVQTLTPKTSSCPFLPLSFVQAPSGRSYLPIFLPASCSISLQESCYFLQKHLVFPNYFFNYHQNLCWARSLESTTQHGEPGTAKFLSRWCPMAWHHPTGIPYTTAILITACVEVSGGTRWKVEGIHSWETRGTHRGPTHVLPQGEKESSCKSGPRQPSDLSTQKRKAVWSL